MSLINHRYRKLQNLSAGGFGNTFLAEDTQIPSGRRCVIKQLRPVTNDPAYYQLIQDRFYREAVILEKLGQHPQIPELYAYFTENNLFYLVQEWIPGSTLGELIQQNGKLGPEFVQPCLSNLLGVLSYVHQQHIIHRDIKPANIILRSTDNQPCLIDFGAVKEILSAQASGQNSQTIVIGTPGYTAPEQMRGQPIFASDLYSLGYTAIQCLIGSDPRDLPTDPATGQLEWRSQLVGVPPNILLDVLDRAIMPEASQRYLSAVDMQRALMGQPASPPPTGTAATVAVSPAQTATPVAKSAPQTATKKAGWLLSAGIFLCLVGGAIAGGYFILANQSSPPPEPTPSPTQPSPEPSTTPTPSPSGSPSPKPPVDPNLDPGDIAQVINVRSNDFLALLSGPGIQNKQVGCLPYNAKLIEVIGQGETLNESVWLPVQYFGLQGWVSGRYLSKQPSSGGIPNVVPPSESIGGVRGVKGISANDADPVLFMLDGPGVKDEQRRDRPIVGCIPYDGTGVNVLNIAPVAGQSDWAQVWYRGTVGWVNSKYLTNE